MEDDPRPIDAIRRHFEVERELAARLLHTNRSERTRIFRTLYDELFARVPDHPRLLRRETEESSARAVAARMRLLTPFLTGVSTFLEFAPGDCRLAYEVCRHAKKVYGVDISDQSGSAAGRPYNFDLIVYDGYNLDIADQSVDLVFSYQFLEHLHPDDVDAHFALVYRILKPGGAYIFSTPHRFSGPHDVSRLFSDTPQGFHFREWTFFELGRVVTRLGFGAWHTYRFGKPRLSSPCNLATVTAEHVIDLLPRRMQRVLSARMFNSVTMICRK
ncbi:MAG: class I SAM-dependent methyltransferase [Verrucomicrobiota bacterium]